MKPSERIHQIADVFKLSNTIGSSQLMYMWENEAEVINQNAGEYIIAILKYLDEKDEQTNP